MPKQHLRERRVITRPRQKHERRKRTLVVTCTLLAVAGITVVAVTRDSSPSSVALQSPAAFAQNVGGEVPDLAMADDVVEADVAELAEPAGAVGSEPAAEAEEAEEEVRELTDDCIVESRALAWGSDNTLDVMCLQQALARDGWYDGPISGDFGYETSQAVETFQTENDLFVDGVAGRETALALDIWPEEDMGVVRTTPLPRGTTDSWGIPVSTVTALGDDIPPLPANSGSGYRVVYERYSQRVWAVDSDGTVLRSWLVSGSTYFNEVPGTHQVYSRSEVSTAWNGRAYLPLMIRWYKTELGALGFHGIPTRVDNGEPYQTEDDLGSRLSGGCQRQADNDARFLWAFAEVGTTVVVL